MSGKKSVDGPSFTIDWRIENYIPKWKDVYVTSSDFRPHFLRNIKWTMFIQSKSELNGQDDFNFTVMKHRTHDCLTCTVNCEYSFLDANEQPIFTKTVRNHDFVEIEMLQLHTGLMREDVFGKDRSKYLPRDTLTIRFRMWKTHQAGVTGDDEYCHTRTVIGLDRVCVTWNIKRFSLLQQTESLTKFLHFGNSSSSISVELSLVGESLETSAVKLKLDEVFLDMDYGQLLWKISLLDIDGKPVKSLQGNPTLREFFESLPLVLPTFLTRQEVMENRSLWLQDGDLSLLFEFEMDIHLMVETIYYRPADLKTRFPKPYHSEVPSSRSSEEGRFRSSTSEPKNDSVTTLLKDFMKLFREKTLHDFELRSEDKYPFPVHKVVLCARSPVFRSIITKESKSHDVNDIDRSTLIMMLKFMYGASFEPEISRDSAIKLYNAALNYEVQSLWQQCSAILQSSISSSNICETLVLADKHGDDELRYSAHDFILENVDDIMSSVEWNEFQETYLQLAGATMQVLLRRMSRKKLRVGTSSTEVTEPTSSSMWSQTTNVATSFNLE